MDDLVWEVSGRDGQRGEDGQAGADGSLAGRIDGEGGAPGGRGEDGAPGGRIQARLWLESEGVACLEGHLDGRPRVDRWEIQTTGGWRLRAEGGSGGQGGNGGKGGDGTASLAGADATSTLLTHDGRPGGNGGAGGPAGRGGDGGPGGSIELEVLPEDLDLLLFVLWNVSAGEIGYAGASGPGGKGGPGGKSGESGAFGHAGRKAEAGTFQLITGGQSYPGRFSLACSSRCEVAAAEGSKIFEFGQKGCVVTGLEVNNYGQGPSPDRTVRIDIVSRDDGIARGCGLALESLPPEGHLELPPLTFDLCEAEEGVLPAVHERYKKTVLVESVLHYSRLQRDDSRGSFLGEIEVTFPLELQTIAGPNALPPGQDVVVSWRVHNLSSREFPLAGRQALLRLRVENSDFALQVCREGGKPVLVGNGSAVFAQLEPIPPLQSVLLSAVIRAPVESVPYSKARLVAELMLTPCGGGPPRAIQQNPVVYSVALTGELSEAEVCLITHAGCAHDEVKSWLELFAKLNMRCLVWDLSHHGFWPIEQSKNFVKGKLVVVLESEFCAPDRTATRPSEFFNPVDFRDSIASLGLSYYFIADRGMPQNFMLFSPPRREKFSSPSAYLRRLSRRERHEFAGPYGPETPLDCVEIKDVSFSDSTESNLRKKAIRFLKRLHCRSSRHRFHITITPGPDYCYQATLQVRRLPRLGLGTVVTRQTQKANRARPEFLFSSENLLGLFSALNFQSKLCWIAKLSEAPKKPWLEAQNALADAILLDLSEQQLMIQGSSERFSSKDFALALNLVTEFCSADFRIGGVEVGAETSLSQLLLRVVAGLKFLTEGQLSPWSHRVRLLGGTDDLEIQSYIQDQLDTFLDRNFGPDRSFLTGQNRRRAQALIEERQYKLGERKELILRQSKTSGVKLSAKAATAEALVRWELRDCLSRAISHHLSSGDRCESWLWTEQQIKEQQAREQEHALRQQALAWLYQTDLSS